MPHELKERRFSTKNFARTVTMQVEGLERLDEFVTDLFESARNVPCQFGTYNTCVIVAVHGQWVPCIFRLKELG